MKLKPRTTYRNGNGDRVSIAGLARTAPVDSEPVFWSIQGDHYTESGKFVVTKRTTPPARPEEYERVTNRESLRNIASEDTSPDAVSWWDGVKTEGLS